MRTRATVLALLLGLITASALHGQSRITGADLRGSVRDQSAAALVGAVVTATSMETNALRTAVSDGSGRYSIAALPPGAYRITAEMKGFATRKREGVTLHLGQNLELDFTLPLGGLGEDVTVVEEVGVVDPHRTAVASVVGQQQIENLPINGRNFMSFSVITPGVGLDNTPQQGASATSGLSFTGQRARSNNIMVDGLDNNDPIVGSVRATFSQEAVREFQVLTNSYSAEFGKASGGVVNIVTKSGTNELSGNAFVFARDDSLNAKDHFEKFDVFGGAIDRAKAPYKQWQYGATLGGPIRKDKTFFFLSFERLDIEANNFVTISDADAAVLSRAGFPVQPGPNPYDFKDTLLLGKVNHYWSQSHSLALRGNYSKRNNENIEPFGGLTARSRGAVQLRTDYGVSLAETDILSPRWVNEARLQWAHEEQHINSLDPNCGGPCTAFAQGGPTLEVAGVASVGRQRFTPQPRTNDRLQLTDTLTYATGNHSAKAGFDLNWIDSRDTALPLHFGGRYLFRPLPAIPGLLPTPISAIQAVALGIPAAYIQGYGTPGGPYRNWDVSLFVQDDWRVSRKLLIKPGLRYQRQYWPDYHYTVSDVGGQAFSYDFPGDGNNFAPRIAVAFDPMANGRTSLHAAYGIFYDNEIVSIGSITDEIRGGAGVRTLVARFPSPAVLAAWRAPGHRLPEATALALLGGSYPSLVISPDPGLETPYSHQAAVGLEQAIGADFALSANAVYVRGKRQVGTVDFNPVVPALGAGRRPNDRGGIAGTSASILQYSDFGETWYKGITVSLSKRRSHRHEFLLAYTLGKAEDNSTDFQSAFIPQDNGRGRNPQDPTGVPVAFSADLERGPAINDQRHRLVFSGLVEMPWGLQASTIVSAASGRPFTPIAGADLNGDGDGGAIPGPDRARRTLSDAASSVGRNSENLPATFTVDLRLSKRLRIGKKGALDLIAEAFNLLDRVNYSEVNNLFGTGAFPDQPQRDGQGRVTYGTFTAAQAPRQIQLAAKVSF
jgi:carboxypeptidase family protein/TonB-dependent receptor-like protein